MNPDDRFKKYKEYKVLLESIIMIPFRRLRFISNGAILPILLDQVKVSVDRTCSSTTRYTMNLSYGRHEWRVVANVIQIFSLNTYLYYKGVTDLKRDRPDLYTNERYNHVERFLRMVLYKSRLMDIGKIYDFFRMSRYSFVGEKGFEEKLYVRISEHQGDYGCGGIGCYDIHGRFRKMYVVCKKTHVIFIDHKNDHEVVDVLFYTGDLMVEHKRHTFHSRVMIIKDGKRYSIKSFDHELIGCVVQEIHDGETRLRTRRFGSFSPVRMKNVVNFYVDGKSYFENLYETLKLARNEIFIAGWWIYPRLYLKRILKNGILDDRYRLDCVLKRLANDGISIKIMIYREVQIALSINSSYTYEFLSKLHRNIEIVRHPGFTNHIPIYWSHHEKIVVIDQRIAYVGGIDLTLGRYDMKTHLLFDVRSTCRNESRMPMEVIGSDEEMVWPGMDFSNPLKKDFVGIGRGEMSLIDRNVTPRMPWHDIQCKVVGSSAFDVSRHFVERWNFVVSLGYEPGRIDLLVPNEEFLRADMDGGCVSTQVLRSVGEWSLGIKRENSIERGYMDIIDNAERFIYIENQFFITKCNDLASGHPENSIGARLAERILRAARNEEKFKVYVVIPLLPAFEMDISAYHSSNTMEMVRIQLESISRGGKSLISVLRRNGVDASRYVVFMSLRKIHFDGRMIAQEQIYVHSKVIIADGTRGIIGSANLNDRSMIGDRDTEIGLFVEDKQGGIIDRLLRRLLMEHLGIDERGGRNEVDRFLDDYFFKSDSCCLDNDYLFNYIVNRARNNTRIFRRLFRSLPDDEMRTMMEYSEFNRRSFVHSIHINDGTIHDAMAGIHGHLVLFPCDFLIDEQFEGDIFSIQGLLPSIIFY